MRNGILGLTHEPIVENHSDTLFRLRVVSHPFLAAVAVLTEDQALDAKLNPVGRPKAQAAIGFDRPAVLIIHRCDDAVEALQQIEFRDHAEPFA